MTLLSSSSSSSCYSTEGHAKTKLRVILSAVLVSAIICGLGLKWSSDSCHSNPLIGNTSDGVLTFNKSTLAINGGSSSSSSQRLMQLFIKKATAKIRSSMPTKIPNTLFRPTRVSKRFSKLQRLEKGLARVRGRIRNATRTKTFDNEDDFDPRETIYRNGYEFHQSYLEMEKIFKIFIYEDGNPPLFHSGTTKNIYSTEGIFNHGIEINEHFRTRNPDRAHLYFLPFSIERMVHFLYVPDSYDIGPVKRTVIDYIQTIARKYPYWNRSLGADHFMLSCHDWGPLTSSYNPFLFNNSIRALCNANTSEGFNPTKDVSFPEIYTRKRKVPIGGLPPSSRSILAFFAGQLHGDIRMTLIKQWEGKDPEILVYDHYSDRLYSNMMRKSKYCLCPSGYEVASPRIVEAIYAECVPVLISDSYIPPFSDVLNWSSFSIRVSVNDIPNLKTILMDISIERYIEMSRNVKVVQRHFLVNHPPVRLDVFHMIIHSIWLRRLNILINDN